MDFTHNTQYNKKQLERIIKKCLPLCVLGIRIQNTV